MKSLTVLFVAVLLSSSAFAAETCFKLKGGSQHSHRLCLSEVHYIAYDSELKRPVLKVYGGNLEGTYYIRESTSTNEDQTTLVTARLQSSQSEPSCGGAKWISIVIKLTHVFMTPISPKNLDVSGEIVATLSRTGQLDACVRAAIRRSAQPGS